MMNHRMRGLTALALATLALVACSKDAANKAEAAEASKAAEAASSAPGADKSFEELKKAIMIAGAPEAPTEIRDSQLPGFKEAVVQGRIAFVSNDGRYVIQGLVMDTQERRNLAQEAEARLRVPLLASFPTDERIVFKAKDEKHRLTVFTDFECGYCRKLHQDMPKLNDMGITVEYVPFPRGGTGAPVANVMTSAWCSSNKQQALTDAKAGKTIASATCDAPIAKGYDLGSKIGVRGTPAIYSPKGMELGGYLPPEAIIAALNHENGTEAKPGT